MEVTPSAAMLPDDKVHLVPGEPNSPQSMSCGVVEGTEGSRDNCRGRFAQLSPLLVIGLRRKTFVSFGLSHGHGYVIFR